MTTLNDPLYEYYPPGQVTLLANTSVYLAMYQGGRTTVLFAENPVQGRAFFVKAYPDSVDRPLSAAVSSSDQRLILLYRVGHPNRLTIEDVRRAHGQGNALISLARIPSHYSRLLGPSACYALSLIMELRRRGLVDIGDGLQFYLEFLSVRDFVLAEERSGRIYLNRLAYSGLGA